MAPITNALHFCMRMVFRELPEEANILCVGAGTGMEVLALTQEHPKWRFTLVEPSPAMMQQGREQMEANGLTARCTFYEGYLNTLPHDEAHPFDAATCLLVSQFIMVNEDRISLYADIARRLRPGGLFINADITSDMSSVEYQNLVKVWQAMFLYADFSADISHLGKMVAVLPAKEVEALLTAAGFKEPTLFYQSLLIHAWFSRVGGK